MSGGRFITFEGGEGAGKSTHVRRLADMLGNAGKAVFTTREPGGSTAAEAIRALLLSNDIDHWDGMTEVLLHFAARREHLADAIHPAIGRGEWVICDRFADSTRAYQGYGHGVELDLIDQVYALVVGTFRPDLTLILDVPPEEGLRRTRSRGDRGDRYERMGLDFHRRLRQGFLEIAKSEPDRCVVIDAASPIDRVAQDVEAAVRDRLADSSL